MSADSLSSKNILNESISQNTAQELMQPLQDDSSKTTILQDTLSRQSESILWNYYNSKNIDNVILMLMEENATIKYPYNKIIFSNNSSETYPKINLEFWMNSNNQKRHPDKLFLNYMQYSDSAAASHNPTTINILISESTGILAHLTLIMENDSKLKNELSDITDTLKILQDYPPARRKIIQEER